MICHQKQAQPAPHWAIILSRWYPKQCHNVCFWVSWILTGVGVVFKFLTPEGSFMLWPPCSFGCDPFGFSKKPEDFAKYVCQINQVIFLHSHSYKIFGVDSFSPLCLSISNDVQIQSLWVHPCKGGQCWCSRLHHLRRLRRQQVWCKLWSWGCLVQGIISIMLILYLTIFIAQATSLLNCTFCHLPMWYVHV